MNIVEPRPMSICISVDYCRGYNDAAQKANENTNLIDGEKFRHFLDKLGRKYGYPESVTLMTAYLDDFMGMTEEEIEKFYFT